MGRGTPPLIYSSAPPSSGICSGLALLFCSLLPPRYRARIEEDEALFFNHLIRVHRTLQKDDEETARREFQKAAVFAERLKKDTKSTQFASSHANAPNALEASYVTRAYSRYLSRFGPPPKN